MDNKSKRARVMVFGTFDGLHAGHLSFFRQARGLLKGKSTLVASIARDKNVKRIKGVWPTLNERERLMLVKKCGLVDKVVLAGAGDHIPHIVRERPGIIALGYDQGEYVKNLKKDLKNKGLTVKIIRLRPFKKRIFKNHLLKKLYP